MDEIEDLELGPKEDHMRDEIKDEELGPKEDVEEGIVWMANSMRQRLEALHRNPSDSPTVTIFLIPENIRKNKRHLFEPAVISIGPYHHGQPHLRVMEEKKWHYLRDFLSRGENVSLEGCIRAVKKLEMRARMCYNQTIDMNSDAFNEMMVLDGCFLLEFLINLGPKSPERYEDAGWGARMIQDDLILMENQIPYFILQRLYHCIRGRDIYPQTYEKMVSYLLGKRMVSINVRSPLNIVHHLLHLCHHYIVPANMLEPESPNEIGENKEYGNLCPRWISHGPKKLLRTCINVLKVPHSEPSWSIESLPCATELQEAGVRIRKKKPPCDFTNVTFQSGTLDIPFLIITDSTPVVLMNLVVSEQCESLRLTPIISSYCIFMDAIVNTANDVTILERQGIIGNMLSGEEEVALFLNQISQHVIIYQDHYLAGLFKEINKYCKSRKHRYRAKLMGDYFNSPWSMLSLFAAVLLLLLTSTQTFYAALAYHRPPHT